MAVTIKEIADHVGVSAPAVSYALNNVAGHVSPETRSRILVAAKRLGYRPSSSARAMRIGRTRNIGVVIHGLGMDSLGSHVYDAISGINSIIEPAGFTTCLIQMHDVEADDEGMARVFREQVLDGMIVLAALKPEIRDHLGQLVDKIIWCDSGVQKEEGCLWRDEVKAGRLAAEALIAAGYHELFYLDSSPKRHYLHAKERRRGVLRAAEESGVPCELVPTGVHASLGNADAVFARLSPRTGVVCSEYWHVYSMLNTGLPRGITPPHGFGMVCADETSMLGTGLPALGLAVFDRFAMGQQAARMMLQRLEHPRRSCPSWISRPVWRPGLLAPGPAMT